MPRNSPKPKPNKVATERNKPNGNQHQTTPPPPPAGGIPNDKTKYTSEETNPRQNFEDNPTNRRTKGETWWTRTKLGVSIERAGFLLGIVLAGFTIRLVYLTKDQLNVSQEQLALSRESSHIELKAWLNVSSLPDSIFERIGTQKTSFRILPPKYEFKFTVKNSGKTTAYNVIVNAKLFWRDIDDPPVIEKLKIDSTYSYVIAPETEMEFTGSSGEIDPTRRGYRFWIVGHLHYTDVFQDTTVVSFRYLYIDYHKRFIGPEYNEETRYKRQTEAREEATE